MFLRSIKINQSIGLWCLYNKRNKKHLKGLTQSEVQSIVMALESEQVADWMVCYEGWAFWKSLKSIEALHLPFERPIENIPSVYAEEGHRSISTIDTFTKEMQGDFENIPDLVVESPDDFVDRAHERVDRVLQVIVDCNGQLFNTFSEDVSVGGVLVRDPLPDWVAGYCTIKLTKIENQETVTMSGSIVENQDPLNRVRLSFAPLKTREDESNFFYWLAG